MRDKHSPQKILVTITLAVVLLLGSAITVIAWRIQSDDAGGKTKTAATENRDAKAEAAEPTLASSAISYKGQDGKNALELLQQNAKVVTKESSFGPYVETINGVTGGESGKYWAFYINGELAQVGAHAYTTKSTDKIEWKFE